MNNLTPPLVYLGLIEQNDCAGIRRVGCNWAPPMVAALHGEAMVVGLYSATGGRGFVREGAASDFNDTQTNGLIPWQNAFWLIRADWILRSFWAG